MTQDQILPNGEVDISITKTTTTIDLSHLTTTSAKIRHLLSLNYKRSDIAKMLNIRYQHVRNVELMPIKKTI